MCARVLRSNVMRLLLGKGAEVVFHDPYVAEVRDENEVYRSVQLTDALLRECDCVVITTDHQVIDYAELVRKAPLVVDTRNATRQIASDKVVGLSGSASREPMGAPIAASV